MKIYEIFKNSFNELIQQYPEIRKDLISVGEWFNTTPDKLSYNLSIENISKYETTIKEMLSTYDEFPKDAARTKKIIKILQNGGKPLPIFVDDHNFVMEGRHRIVAFHLLNIKMIPVIHVNGII